MGQGMQKGRDGYQTTTGVCIERNDRHCVIYRGTRAALIAAGLARPGHFPEGQRRFSWHFPKSGVNWGVRRKGGDVYCLTKLKDPQGIVEAELTVFYRSAGRAARRDAGFQSFLAQMQREAVRLGEAVLSSDTQRPSIPSRAAGVRRTSGNGGGARAPNTSGLESLAVATLLFGLTVYFWTRQA